MAKVLPSQRQWRTQIYVRWIEKGNASVWVSGCSMEDIVLEIASLPDEIQKIIRPNLILHAQVNIGAKAATDLVFTDWESS